MAHMSRKTTWHERRRHEEGTTEVTWLVAVGLWDFRVPCSPGIPSI